MQNVQLKRRTLLKGLGLSALAMTPVLSQAAIFSQNQKSGLSLEIADADISKVNGGLVRISIRNHTDKTIELRELASGAINVDGHSYNLNERLAKTAISVGPQGTYHVWLHPEQDTAITAAGFTGAPAQKPAQLPVTVLWGKPGQYLQQHTQITQAILA